MKVEWEYGKCRNCGEWRMITFVLGTYKGQMYAGKVCNDCLIALQEERSKDD